MRCTEDKRVFLRSRYLKQKTKQPDLLLTPVGLFRFASAKRRRRITASEEPAPRHRKLRPPLPERRQP
jgi:hypothetical protein